MQFIVSSSGPINNPEDLVGKPDDYQCVGTLISSKWVLTAKHCVTESYADTANSGVLVGDRTRGQGTPHRLASIHEDTGTDSALLELTEDATEEAPVPYSRATLEVDDEVEIRGWGSSAPELLQRLSTPGAGYEEDETDGEASGKSEVLQLATMEVASLEWSGANEGNTMLLKDIYEGVAETGDSGAGVYLGGSIYGLVSTSNNRDEASAVPTATIADWIVQTSGVTPSSAPVTSSASASASAPAERPQPTEPVEEEPLTQKPGPVDEPPIEEEPAEPPASASPCDSTSPAELFSPETSLGPIVDYPPECP